jgi:beta-glucanase (GH16 family)
MAYRNYSGAWLPDTNQAGVRYVRGTWADETLQGSSGADEFEGGGGWDTFIGGGGDDFYWLRDGRHPVIEQPGGGIDTVKIWSSHALAANVENLIVFGDGSHAVGNDLNNIIRGEDGAQYIYGGRGEDVLVGGNGADTFVIRAGEGNKVIEDFSSWNDKLRLIGGPLTSFDAVKAAMTQQGSDVVLNDGGTMILFRNATVGQFAARDFQLPMNPSQLGQLTFSDEFNTLQTGSVWKTNFGYAGDGINSFTLPRNGEQQIYVSPEFKGTTGSPLGLNPYSVNNGVLTITAQPVSDALAANMWGYHYQSGMLDSNFTQTYGYFEIRAEVPQGQGLWPAFWLLGPDNNEIDILEQIGSDPRVPQQAVHSNAGHWGGGNFVPDIGGFHTYGALWSPTEVIFYVDGTEVVRTATPSDMNKPMHMIVNLAVGGNWPGSPDGSTPWPARMNIDYVKVYALPGATAPPPVVSPPPPPPPTTGSGVSLTSSGFGATMTGTSGADTLTAGNGAEQMTGGAGADVFVWTRVPWNPSEVRDFQVGVDKLSLSALMGGYSGSDALADRRLVLESDGAGGTKVSVDADGAGGRGRTTSSICRASRRPG